MARLSRTGFFPSRLRMMSADERLYSPSARGRGQPVVPSPEFSALFEASVDPMLVVDASLHVVAANPSAARFLHVPRERMNGLPVLEVELLARLLAAASIPQRLKMERSPVVDEVAVTDAEGQAVQCAIEALALPDGRALIHLADTTRMLKAQAALRAMEQLHHAIFEALPQVCWTMALPEERLLEVSPSVERLFGYQPADFRQRPELWDEMVHPTDRERVRAEVRSGLGSGRPFEIHFTGLHRDHHDLPHLVCRVIPAVDERGWVSRCAGLIENLGQQHALETTLRATQSNLRHTLEAVSSGVLVVRPGPSGPEVVLCNRRLADMLSLDEPPRPGLRLSTAPAALRELIYGEASETEFERRILSEQVQDEVIELAERQRALHRYGGPVRDERGRVEGRIVTVEDVTSTWLMQRRLTHAQKMESMGRLAGGVAHDFNNLLGTILGFTSLLLEETPPGDARRNSLEQVAQAADRASNLTAALLAFSRSARFERTPVNLNRVIEDSYQILRSTLDPSVSITMQLEPALPPLQGDHLLLQQVIVNLVQEVRDRLLGGGALQLSTSVFEQPKSPEERDEGTRARRMVSLEIQAGSVAGDRRPEPARRSGNAPDSGTGLALTIVEDIVRAHGGYLVSHPGSDSAYFEAVFPAESRPESPMIAAPTGAARGHETILVVDDEPGLRALARSGLRRRGFDVVTVESGEQALEILRKQEPHVDLVLLDLTMPGLSGEKVLRTIRSFLPDLPVIIASGYATSESQSSWNAAGAMGFIAKPYRIQDVAVKLREVLDRAPGPTP